VSGRLRPCIVCGTPSRGARCPSHAGAQRSVRNSSAWQRVRAVAKARDGHACQHCGGSRGGLSVHHIVSLARGGTNELENLVTLCARCHARAEGRGLGSDRGREKLPRHTPPSVSQNVRL
jgi:5-methylcytosine-specific restriction endonuclease McrA